MIKNRNTQHENNFQNHYTDYTAPVGEMCGGWIYLTTTLLPNREEEKGDISMSIQWEHNVRYEPDTQRVIFERNGERRSSAERIMEYLEELYPEKSWLEIACMAVPELKSVKNMSAVRFYSL